MMLFVALLLTAWDSPALPPNAAQAAPAGAHVQIEQILDVDPDTLYGVILDYEAYPQFLNDCILAKLERRENNQVTVAYAVNLVKKVDYRLEHTEIRERHTMSWKMVSSDFMTKNSGSWELIPAGKGRTKVKYWAEIEINGVPQFLVNAAVEKKLPAMMRDFETRAKAKKPAL
jgi:ribosome-associated toxin RatA of RatAB toxin-antitoxin module